VWINRADAVITDICVYGKDTAWEVGYCYGIGNTVIGFAGNKKYKSDFTVRGSLTRVARDKKAIVEMIRNISAGRI
jgi:nucleoside 2-deoxyribosyltransferase